MEPKRRAEIRVTYELLATVLRLPEKHRVVFVAGGDAFVEEFPVIIEGLDCPIVPEGARPALIMPYVNDDGTLSLAPGEVISGPA